MLASIICLAVANRTSSAKPRTVAFVSGAFSLADSKDGGAILTVSNMGPGDSVTGTVTIRNTGTGTGALALSMMNLTDSPGVNHGALSGALGLQLTDITHGSDAAVYSGGLGAMPEQRLVTLSAGDARTYRFTVDIADHGSPGSAAGGDNAFQGASARVDYRWTLSQAAGGRCQSRVEGGPGPNRLIGTEGGDLMFGRAGPDRIKGLGGPDCIMGGPASDHLFGGSGSDRLEGGRGRDRIWGGPGSDVIIARGSRRDWIRCGDGADTAVVDRRDLTFSCETVRRQSPEGSAAQSSR